MDLALPILQKLKNSQLTSQAKEGEDLVDNDRSPSEASIFDTKTPAMLSENECEILRKLLKLVHQSVHMSCVKDKLTTMTEGVDDHGEGNTRVMSRIVKETQIVDMYILCFGVRNNMVNESLQCGVTDVVEESMTSFLELLPDIPPRLIEKRGEEILGTLYRLLQGMVTEGIKAVDQRSLLACNNLCWTLGELSMLIPDLTKPYVPAVVTIITDLLNSELLT